jgi:hypothetical protein
MYKAITDHFIIETVSNYDSAMALINDKMDEARKIMQDTDQLIQNAAMPGKIEEGMSSYGSGDIKDLYQTYERYQKIQRNTIRDMTGYMRELMERQDSMNRIYACYMVLCHRERRVLELLYKNEYMKVAAGILEAEEEFCASRSSVIRFKQKALGHIKELYASNLTHRQIFLLKPDMYGNFNLMNPECAYR